jgi:CrcB protein
VLRYALAVFIPTPPIATLAVNVLGSFLLTLFASLAMSRGFSEPTRLLLTTGICGGFTTYSTFNAELLQLGPQKGALYAFATLGLCLGAGLLGQRVAAFY